MYANDSYLRLFRLKSLVRAALDLGANRGLFSLIALMALEAEIVVGVEPLEFYEPVMRILLDANGGVRRAAWFATTSLGEGVDWRLRWPSVRFLDRTRDGSGSCQSRAAALQRDRNGSIRAAAGNGPELSGGRRIDAGAATGVKVTCSEGQKQKFPINGDFA
jgi:hypothetical protein